jgi:hypothetical protein
LRLSASSGPGLGIAFLLFWAGVQWICGHRVFDNANTVWWDATGGSGADAIALTKLAGVAALRASDFLLA